MAMSVSDLEAIEILLADASQDGSIAAALRRQLPHLSLSQCDAADVIEPPFRSYPCYDLHLLDTTDHCVQITIDPQTATGIIMARRDVS